MRGKGRVARDKTAEASSMPKGKSKESRDLLSDYAAMTVNPHVTKAFDAMKVKRAKLPVADRLHTLEAAFTRIVGDTVTAANGVNEIDESVAKIFRQLIERIELLEGKAA
jgi:hypothetical protein